MTYYSCYMWTYYIVCDCTREDDWSNLCVTRFSRLQTRWVKTTLSQTLLLLALLWRTCCAPYEYEYYVVVFSKKIQTLDVSLLGMCPRFTYRTPWLYTLYWPPIFSDSPTELDQRFSLAWYQILQSWVFWAVFLACLVTELFIPTAERSTMLGTNNIQINTQHNNKLFARIETINDIVSPK